MAIAPRACNSEFCDYGPNTRTDPASVRGCTGVQPTHCRRCKGIRAFGPTGAVLGRRWLGRLTWDRTRVIFKREGKAAQEDDRQEGRQEDDRQEARQEDDRQEDRQEGRAVQEDGHQEEGPRQEGRQVVIGVSVANDLGDFIAAEVARAEETMAAARNRGQSVLTASGALVTLLAGVIALAAGKDAHLNLSAPLALATIASLIGFVAATVLVLLMYLPSQVVAIDVQDASEQVEDHWDDEGWDRQVAAFQVHYLGSLRGANDHLLGLLYAAIIGEVVGIACVAVLVVTLLFQAL